MAFQLKSRGPVDADIRRSVDKQLALAIGQLRSGTLPSDYAVHEARRHVKKSRAALRLVRPVLRPSYRAINQRLRTIGRMLAPITDGEAIIDTLGRLEIVYPGDVPHETLTAVREALVARKQRLDAHAAAQNTFARVIGLLETERDRVARLRLTRHGFRSLAPGLKHTMRAARRAMAAAASEPTAEHHHAWRRRVKDHWLHVRLLERRCGAGLAADRSRLEVLDGCLGEYHNCAILRDVLSADAPVSRQASARCLRVLRRYQAHLRREARRWGHEIYQERPRAFVKRVRRLWRAAKTAARAEEPGRWPTAA